MAEQNSLLDTPRSEIELILACAGYCAGYPLLDAIESLLDIGIDWDDFSESCRLRAIYPLAYRALSSAKSGKVPGRIIDILQRETNRNGDKALRLQAELIRLSRLFDERRIRHIPLKGPPLAYRLFGDIGMRSSVDIDLFIDIKDIDRAEDILRRAGYRRSFLERNLSPLQRRHLLRNIHHFEFRHGTAGHWLDLHWKLDGYDRLKVGFDQAIERGATMEISGKEMTLLSNEDEFLHLLFHAGKHKWRSLKWLADLAALAKKERGFDWGILAERAVELKIEDAVGHALILLRDIMNAPIQNDMPARLAGGRKAKRLAASAKRFIIGLPAQHSWASKKISEFLYMADLFGAIGYPIRQYCAPRAKLFHLAPIPDALFPVYYPLNAVHMFMLLFGIEPGLRSDLRAGDVGPSGGDQDKAPGTRDADYSALDGESVPAHSRDAVWRESDGTITIAPLNAGDFEADALYRLTGTAVDIWKQIDGARTLAVIAETLAVRYEEAREKIEADLIEFAGELAGRGLIVIDETPLFDGPPRRAVEGHNYNEQRPSEQTSQMAGLMISALEGGMEFSFRAHGGSMRPFIKEGDILSVAKLSGRVLHPGDVAAFEEPETGRLLVHRVIEGGENGVSVVTRGDFCPSTDGEIPLENVIGIVERVKRNGVSVRMGTDTERKIIARMSSRGLLMPLVRLLLVPRRMAKSLKRVLSGGDRG